MYDPDLSRSIHADVALLTLERDFPRVPGRVVSAVLDAYLHRHRELPVAVSEARARIADACVAT